MNSTEAAQHIAECRRMLEKADADQTPAYCIGALIIAIDQLAEVVADLAQREQGRIIG